jgi:hypothetical protein
LRFLEEYRPWFAFLSAVIRQPDGSVHRLPLCGKESFQILRLDDPLVLALTHEKLDNRGHLVEPAEDPDEKDDRDGYTDQPQQKTSTHSFLLYRWFTLLTAALNFSSNRCQGHEYRCAVAA